MSKLYKNASGCYDPTAYNAILNVANKDFDDEKTNNFIKDIFKVCKKYHICIDGELNIYDWYTGEKFRKLIVYKRKEKGEEDGTSSR